jgi:hypothetical protein
VGESFEDLPERSLVSCVLRAVGTAFDVDGFLRDSPFSGASVFRRGDPRLPGSFDGARRAASGFNVEVSGADLDNLTGKTEEATQFIREHEDELRRLGSFPGVEEVCLDFEIRRRDEAAQRDLFPADLLWHTGALDIDLVVTHYAVADERDGTKPN